MSSNNPPDIQKAVDFFAKAQLFRLLQKLRERYIELGRVGGQITLDDCTPNERRELASFLGKPPFRETRVKIRLDEFDRVLRRSGFACELPDLLNAFFPDTPLVTRPEQRAAHKVHQADFHTALDSIAMEQPADSRGRNWLLHGQHGLDWLFTHNKNESGEEQERQLATVRSVMSALDSLPAPNAPERLALFAQRISGDPHMFDSDRTAGRLLRYALEDILSLSGETSPQVLGSALNLYTNAGLLLDTISSNVAVFNLAGAVCTDGSLDSLPQAASKRVLLLPLRQLLDWQNVMSSSEDVYVFENPQVFEEVIAGLLRSNSARMLPTLVCTSGWPSTAALLLLDLLVTQSPDNHLHYSGDFDLAGLKIAAYLLERYPGRCSLWRFDPDSYLQALHDESRSANRAELGGLNSLPIVFAPLMERMQEKARWAYQEGIAHLLLEDVIAAS